MNYPIAIGLSPNTQTDDALSSIKILLQPWKWKKGDEITKVEKWFCSYMNTPEAAAFNSGRSALFALLRVFNIGKGDEVIIQAFTCVAVPDPIIWVGAKPVYADIDSTQNMDPGQLEKVIKKNTKAIIVQHTFGIPADMENISIIAKKYKLLLIEDCAHSLGAYYHNQKIGTLSDAAFFSFGRDKVISSVFGGMAIINQKSKIKNQKLREYQNKLSYPNYFWILQQLLHPIAFGVILPLYNYLIGKILLFFLLKIHLLSKPVNKEEKSGGRPSFIPAKYPNALANLLLNQLNKLEDYNRKRKEIAQYYFKHFQNINGLGLPEKIEGSIYLRFNVLTDKASKIRKKAKQKGILLGNWYHNIIDPEGTEYQKVNFNPLSFPNAKKAADLSLNLPTYPRLTEKDLNSIVKIIKEYGN